MNKAKRGSIIVFTSLVSLYFLHYLFVFDLHPYDVPYFFIDMVNTVFHEAGHTIFAFFGRFIHTAAGSGFEVFVPAFIAVYFYLTRQYLSSALCIEWTGEAILNTAQYAADAVVRNLSLLGDDGTGLNHDWYNIFSMLHVLQYTDQISFVMYIFGAAVIVVGVSFAMYITLVGKTPWQYDREMKEKQALESGI